MKRIAILLGFLWVSLLAQSTPADAAEQRRVDHVFIVSFDQAAPRIIKKSKMPVYKRMAAEGAHTWEARTIVPSLTLPSHTSMLTGVDVPAHQITWNDYQPLKGQVKVPTLFSMAKARGLTTAMVVGKEKFKHLNLPGSVDQFLVAGDCTAVAEAFAQTVAPQRPNLCFLHFADPDTVGHKFGVGSPEQLAALEKSDKALQNIKEAVQKAGMTETSVFILTSDHGGHNIVDPSGKLVGTHGSAELADVLIPWIAWGKGVRKGVLLKVPIKTYDTTATALWLLGVPVPEKLNGRPVTAAFTPQAATHPARP